MEGEKPPRVCGSTAASLSDCRLPAYSNIARLFLSSLFVAVTLSLMPSCASYTGVHQILSSTMLYTRLAVCVAALHADSASAYTFGPALAPSSVATARAGLAFMSEASRAGDAKMAVETAFARVSTLHHAVRPSPR